MIIDPDPRSFQFDILVKTIDVNVAVMGKARSE